MGVLWQHPFEVTEEIDVKSKWHGALCYGPRHIPNIGMRHDKKKG